MTNCRYIGTPESNGHPYLIGTSGYCNDDAVQLVKKYQSLKSDGKYSKHKRNCNCQRCIDLSVFGSTMVEYSLGLEQDTEELNLYRVHIKHVELTHD